MTLTRILPSLRRSLPDPINLEYWPEHTVVTPTDVIVSGISLLQLVETSGTPLVHNPSAATPITDSRPSASECKAILVVRIMSVGRSSANNLVVRTDAQPGNVRLIWSETRLINRASTARSDAIILGGEYAPEADPSASERVSAVDLPSDLRVGDLLAIPGRTNTAAGAPQ